MFLKNRWTRPTLALFATIGLVWGSTALAQEPSDDDALDRLLEEVIGPESKAADEAKTDSEPSKEVASDDDQADREKPKSSDPEDVDEDLDKLLQGIGESSDMPDTRGQAAPSKPGDADDRPEKPGEPDDAAAGKFDPDQEKLDERLEEILGRIKKKKGQPPSQSSGALTKTIKKMDEVEKKLGEKDTGEQTREDQQQIIEELKRLIQQAQQSGGRGQTRIREIRQAGQQPGQQQGAEQPSNTGTGTGPTKPKQPDARSILAENKDEWGHLPPELRGEMENVFKEEALPARKTLIDRYYLSISRKSLNRER